MKAKEFFKNATHMEGVRTLTRTFCESSLLQKTKKSNKFLVAKATEKFKADNKWNHFHPENELIFQFCGISYWDTPEGAVKVCPGQALLIPKGVPHKEFKKEEDGQMCNISHYITPNAISYHTHIIPIIDGIKSGPRINDQIKSRHSQLIVDLLDEIAKHDTSKQYEAALVDKLFETVLALLGKSFLNSEKAYTYSHLTSTCIQEILSHICSTQLNVAWLAKGVNRSPDYISNTFKKEVGVKITDFINTQRVLLGKDLLQNSLLDISQIARSCGYLDPNYFGRVFKKSCKITPKEYRKLNKKS